MQARRIFHVISRLPAVLIQTFVAKCSVYQRPIVEWIPRRIQGWNTQKTDAVFQDLIQISSYSMFARSQRPAQRNRPFFAILFWRDQARYGRGAGWGVRCAVAGWVLQPALTTLTDCGEKAGNHVSDSRRNGDIAAEEVQSFQMPPGTCFWFWLPLPSFITCWCCTAPGGFSCARATVCRRLQTSRLRSATSNPSAALTPRRIKT